MKGIIESNVLIVCIFLVWYLLGSNRNFAHAFTYNAVFKQKEYKSVAQCTVGKAR